MIPWCRSQYLLEAEHLRGTLRQSKEPLISGNGRVEQLKR